MKISKTALFIMLCLTVGTMTESLAQSTSPDKMISFMRDKGDALAFTLPGWLVRLAGNIADNNLEDNEREMVQELTHHIKKIRFAVSESVPSEYRSKLKSMVNYLNEHKYEPLVEVRDGDTNVNIWGLFEGDIIKRLIISTVEEGDNMALFNIKSDIDMARLQGMSFFKELKAKSMAENNNY